MCENNWIIATRNVWGYHYDKHSEKTSCDWNWNSCVYIFDSIFATTGIMLRWFNWWFCHCVFWTSLPRFVWIECNSATHYDNKTRNQTQNHITFLTFVHFWFIPYHNILVHYIRFNSCIMLIYTDHFLLSIQSYYPSYFLSYCFDIIPIDIISIY